jgi:hypothetical protein
MVYSLNFEWQSSLDLELDLELFVQQKWTKISGKVLPFRLEKCKSAAPENDGLALLKVMHLRRIFLWQMDSSNKY